MFKGQPKGLYALALANTGERFGYYTMLAIFVLFIQAKFGFTAGVTGAIFSTFLAVVYFTPLIGGIIADKWLGFGKTVTLGIVVMFLGYLLLAIPSGTDITAKAMMFAALALIACGTGLFKGNLQVMVGNLYDSPQYSAKRDSAFSLFYMAINVGAMFAPTAATKVVGYFLGKAGLVYNSQLASLSHQQLDGTITADGLAKLQDLAVVAGERVFDLNAFAELYINKLSASYNYGFGVACLSLVFSYLIYVVFRPLFKHADYNAKQQKESKDAAPMVELTKEQTRSRITALLLVFAVVIFFWMAFHQNGLTLTYFARDYTQSIAEGINRIGFDIFSLAFVAIAIYGIFGVFQSEKGRGKLISAAVVVVSALVVYYRYLSFEPTVGVEPQMFQQFNPFFVVALTPFSMAIFGWLANKKKEPSAPRKIGIGMVIAACGFLIMALGSIGLMTPSQVTAAGGSDVLLSPDWLISTYLVLTFAELFLSPMGISFVSKVAPPKYKGAMMGCWFLATALGNQLVMVIGFLWGSMPLWQVWSVLIVLCLLSATFIFSIMKKLESATKDA